MDIKKRTSMLRACLILAIGITGTGVTVAVLKYLSPETGKGGLETPGLPQFSDDKLDDLNALENSDADAEIPQDENTVDSILSYHSYRVQPGDMIGAIADKFGVTQDTIISMNDIRQSRLLQVGQYLKIPNMPGVLYTVQKNGETLAAIAKKYDVNVVKCAHVNNIVAGKTLDAGATVFIPDAALDPLTRQEINGDLFSCPLHYRYYLSSYYGWRASPFTGKRSFHNGIDMAISSGTPIFAALAGKVAAVGYNETYGNYIIVSHYSGYKTLYGHLSAVLIVRGQSVSPATCIGRVGNTGMSTGPHLHFTVFKNGRTVNPLNLLR